MNPAGRKKFLKILTDCGLKDDIFKLKFSIISNASSKAIFQVYFYIFSNHTQDGSNISLTVEENHRSILWQGGHHQNFHYLDRIRFLCICLSLEYFENLSWVLYRILWGSDDMVTDSDMVTDKNYPGLSLLPFKFQIFHNSSPSIWSHWQIIDLHLASMFPILLTTKNRLFNRYWLFEQVMFWG